MHSLQAFVCNVDGVSAPEAVTLLAYDRDKYVTVQGAGEPYSVKLGRVFADAALTRRLNAYRVFGLPTEVGGTKPRRQAVQAEIRAVRQRRHTSYTLWVGSVRTHCRTLAEALLHFRLRYRTHDCALMLYRTRGRCWSTVPVLESVAMELLIPVFGRKKKAVVSQRTLRRALLGR